MEREEKEEEYHARRLIECQSDSITGYRLVRLKIEMKHSRGREMKQILKSMQMLLLILEKNRAALQAERDLRARLVAMHDEVLDWLEYEIVTLPINNVNIPLINGGLKE